VVLLLQRITRPGGSPGKDSRSWVNSGQRAQTPATA
jgi:hypothetical protein